MNKLTKREKMILGVSAAVGAGLAVLGIKQQNKINDLSNQVLTNRNDITEIIGYIQRLDTLMPDMMDVVDRVLDSNKTKGGK